MSHHNIEVCVCGNVLSRCRCMGPHPTVVRPGRCVCAHPKQPPAGAVPYWMLELPQTGQTWRRRDHFYEVVLGQRSLAGREIQYAISGGRMLASNGELPTRLNEDYLLEHCERVAAVTASVVTRLRVDHFRGMTTVDVDLVHQQEKPDVINVDGALQTEKDALEDRAAAAGLRVHQLEQELAAKDAAFSGVNVQLGEYEELFKLQRTRVVAAEKLWKAAHPEAPETLVPDLGELVGWLLNLAFPKPADGGALMENARAGWADELRARADALTEEAKLLTEQSSGIGYTPRERKRLVREARSLKVRAAVLRAATSRQRDGQEA